MSETDVAVLTHLLLGMSDDELRSLHGSSMWWLPDLATASKTEVITAIRGSLRTFRSLDKRVYCVAWVYCCLAERQLIRCWHSYSLRPCEAQLNDDIKLEECLTSALQCTEGHTLYAKTERDEATYACIMTTNPRRATREHEIICLCMPRSLPYLFASVPPYDERRFHGALASVLQISVDKIYAGYGIHLRNVFASVGASYKAPAPAPTDAAKRPESGV